MLPKKPLLYSTSYRSSLVFQHWLVASEGSRKWKQHMPYRRLLIVKANPVLPLPSIYFFSPQKTVMSFKVSNFLFIVSSHKAFLSSIRLWKSLFYAAEHSFVPVKLICLLKRNSSTNKFWSQYLNNCPRFSFLLWHDTLFMLSTF